MGAILAWMAKIVTTGEAVSRRDRETPPRGHEALAAWVLGPPGPHPAHPGVNPADSPAWTFSSLGEQRAGWRRRQV